MKRLLLATLLAVGCGPSWTEKHEAQCKAWMARATNQSDSLNVEMNCATQVVAHRAEVSAGMATVMAASASAQAGASIAMRK